MLHLAEMDTDVSAGGLARQFELMGLEASDLVAQAAGFLEFEIGGGGAHALLEFGDMGPQVVAYEMHVARDAGIDRVVVALGGRLQDLGDVAFHRSGRDAVFLVVGLLLGAASVGLGPWRT